MALRYSTALRVRIGNGWTAAVAAYSFFNSAILEIRSGTIPATADTAPTGTVLASMTLPADATADTVAGLISKLGTWADASADAAGTPSWFRVRDTGDLGTTNTADERLDGTVGTSGTDMILDGSTIGAGQSVTINQFDLTHPAT